MKPNKAPVSYSDVFWKRCLPRHYASSLRMASFLLQILLGLMLVCAINQWVTDALLLYWPDTEQRLLWTSVAIIVAMVVFGFLIYSFFHMFSNVAPHAAEEHLIALLQTNITTGLNAVTPSQSKQHPEEITTGSITHALPTAQTIGLRSSLPPPPPSPSVGASNRALRHRSSAVPIGYSPRTIFGNVV